VPLRCLYGGGQGRNRTTDTRIFKRLLDTTSPSKSTTYSVLGRWRVQRLRVFNASTMLTALQGAVISLSTAVYVV